MKIEWTIILERPTNVWVYNALASYDLHLVWEIVILMRVIMWIESDGSPIHGNQLNVNELNGSILFARF